MGGLSLTVVLANVVSRLGVTSTIGDRAFASRDRIASGAEIKLGACVAAIGNADRLSITACCGGSRIAIP